MRFTVLAVTAALFFCTCPHRAFGAPAATDEASIRQLEDSWFRSLRDRDQAGLENGLAPDYTFTVAVAGKPLLTIPRAEYLKRAAGYVVHDAKVEETVVRIYGDVAVATSRYRQRAVLHGRDRSGQFVLTDTFVKLDGEWLAAARVSSRPEQTSALSP